MFFFAKIGVDIKGGKFTWSQGHWEAQTFETKAFYCF